MDDPNVSRSDLTAALRFIRGVNHILGGRAALIDQLKIWSERWPPGATITLLDVATGSADLPIAAHAWAAARGFDLRITGIDIHDTTLALATEHAGSNPAITLQKLDARAIVTHFGERSFDYVHAGLFLHHLADTDVIAVLSLMSRASRRAIVWNDLVRSRLGEAVTWAITLGQPRIVRHDATVSVRAGFTRDEALSLAASAGLPDACYRWNILTHRFVVAAETPPSR